MFTRLPVPWPFCTRKLARSCKAPWTLPEFSEADIFEIRVSSGLAVWLLELEDVEASSACKSVFTLAMSFVAAEASPEVRSLRSDVMSFESASEEVEFS